MKTSKDIAIMLGGLSFIRVDGLLIYGYIDGGRVCIGINSYGSLDGMWGITEQGFIIAVTKHGEIWVRWNKGLPDITDPKINMCEPLFEKMNCLRSPLVDDFTLLRICEHFDTRQLLSRMNDPEWEPGD